MLVKGVLWVSKLVELNNSPPNQRLLWLDALRGFAAFAVLMYHARAAMWVGLHETWARYGTHPDLGAALGYMTTPFMFGHLGVQLFFVVSGFSIHMAAARRLQSDENRAQLFPKRFFIRRFVRLYPTYVLAFLSTALVDAYLIRHVPETVVGIDSHSWASFWATLVGLQGITAPFFGSADVFWTLMLEMHLYLAYPLLFLLSKRKGPEMALCLTLGVQLITTAGLHWMNAEVVWPFWHAGGPVFLKYWFTWTCGFYVAELAAGRGRWHQAFSLPVGVMSLGVGLVLVGVRHPDLAEAFLAVGFAGMIAAGVRAWPDGSSPKVVLPFVVLGVVSYSLYAIHFPLLRLVRALLNDGKPEQGVVLLSVGIVLTLGAAFLFHWTVDQWSIRWSQSVGRGQKKS